MTSALWIVASAATARRWAEEARSEGFDAVSLPWSEVVPLATAADVRRRLDEVGPDLVLLTSPNAVRALPPAFGKGVEAACVGEATARAARAVGFDVRHVGSGTGADLARALVAAGEPGLLLFLRGESVRREGPDLLEAAGWRVEESVVYEARPRGRFAADVAGAPPPSALVVGSPDAASALHTALGTCGLEAIRDVPAIAIGETTAGRLEAHSFGCVVACEVPSVEGIVAALRGLVRRDAFP